MNFCEYQYAVAQDKRDAYHERKCYLVECRDGEKQLQKLLKYIAENGNGGHSFAIVVDPGDKERERHFFWDGDGADHINAIVASKTGEDKELVGILLTALSRVRLLTWINEHDGNPEIDKYKKALVDIGELVSPLLDGADFDDYMKEALREILFICNSEDSEKQKITDIKFMAESSLH